MSAVLTDAERQERLLIFVKGAPDILLARCSEEFTGEDARSLPDERRRQIGAVNEELAGHGLRMLGHWVPFRAGGLAPGGRHR